MTIRNVGPNKFSEDSFTKEELSKLYGIEKGQLLVWRNDLHAIEETNPLCVSPTWNNWLKRDPM